MGFASIGTEYKSGCHGHSVDTRRTHDGHNDGHTMDIVKTQGFRARAIYKFLQHNVCPLGVQNARISTVSIVCPSCVHRCVHRVSIVCLSSVRHICAMRLHVIVYTTFLNQRVESMTPRCQRRKSFSWSANLCSHIPVRFYMFGGGARPQFATKANCKR